jgi:hypothetical protein
VVDVDAFRTFQEIPISIAFDASKSFTFQGIEALSGYIEAFFANQDESIF